MDTKAILLSFWDAEQQETLKMDLWVKDMPMDQMQLFFHQTLMSLSDTYFRATQDEKMTASMRDFCDFFAEKLALKNG
jgi:gliding motility-associated protein GldC